MTYIIKLFCVLGLMKAAKVVNFSGGISLWATCNSQTCWDGFHKILDFWLLMASRRCGSEGPVSSWGPAGPFLTGHLTFTSLLLGLPYLAHLPQFCYLPGPCGYCLGTQVYMNSYYDMAPIIALFKYSKLEVRF